MPIPSKISYLYVILSHLRLIPTCYTQKEKKIAVNNRWLTDSSVVSEKLKVKEEIKILEDYHVMT